jgi:cysteine protease ATG4
MMAHSLLPLDVLATSRFYFSYTLTDVGFGCMLRSAQMLAASALRKVLISEDEWIPLFLGNYDFDKLRHNEVIMMRYKKLLSTFNHNTGSLGLLSLLDTRTGRSWYGPRTAALKLARAINEDADYPDVTAHATLENRFVFRDQLINDGLEGATILLITCRLGFDSISKPLASSISQWMQDKYCGGMLCGTKGRGLYAFNCDGSHLHCLDPHVLRPELPSIDEDYVLSHEHLCQIHTKEHHMELPIQDMDPEVVISFVFPDRVTLGNWLDSLVVETPRDDDMFSVLEMAPHYSTDTNDEGGDTDGWSVL